MLLWYDESYHTLICYLGVMGVLPCHLGVMGGPTMSPWSDVDPWCGGDCLSCYLGVVETVYHVT